METDDYFTSIIMAIMRSDIPQNCRISDLIDVYDILMIK